LNFLKPYASLIERELQHLNLPDTPITLYEPQRYILQNGGKRIRPILSLLGCGVSGAPIEKAVPAALAVELLHNFTLIHDDIMDQAESRRGEESIHIKWDVSTAILSGDSMFVQAFFQLHRLDTDIDFKWIHKVFADAINRVCEGQALDMEFEERKDVSVEEYLRMISGKTSALTSASLQMGGIAAGTSREKVELLGRIGHSLGIAFQIQDDLLDLTADAEKFGKKSAGDIYEGKKTFLMVHTLERCTLEEKQWLHDVMKNRPLSDGSVESVKALFEKYGVIETAKKQMDTYYKEAENAVETFDDSNYKGDLTNLIKFLKNRDY
jgi:geranylgeranyl diphosphate synthase type II